MIVAMSTSTTPVLRAGCPVDDTGWIGATAASVGWGPVASWAAGSVPYAMRRCAPGTRR